MDSPEITSNNIVQDGAVLNNSLPCTIFTLGITILLFGLFAGAFYFWDQNGVLISPAFSYTAIFAVLLIFFGIFSFVRKNGLKNLTLSTKASCIGLVLVFFSDWLTRGFNLYQGPGIRGEIFALFIILFFSLKSIKTPHFNLIAICSCILLFFLFLYRSQGSPIFSDDHGSFIFRISLLKEHFPNIPIYHPWWNAGLDARDFFATGAIPFFLLTFPFHYLFDINNSYNLSVAFLIFIVMPLSIAYATKLAKITSPAPAIASLLALATSLIWYRWCLKYGTMGFVTSASLMPLTFVLGSKILNQEKLSKIELIIFCISAALSCMWPLGFTCYISLALFAIFRIKSLIFDKQAVLAAVILILILSPWGMMLWKISKVGNFIQVPKTEITSSIEPLNKSQDFRHKITGLDLKKTLKVIREHANGTNPLILFLFLPGLLLLDKKSRFIFLLQSLILLFSGSMLVGVFPQLELDRLLVFLNILLVIPCSKALLALLNNQNQSYILNSLAFSFLFLCPYLASNILYNRSAENYNFANHSPQEVLNVLDKNLTTGRAVFSGFVLHELSSGHIAPLATWLQKPLVASSPFHNRWKYTSVFPKEFISRGEKGIEDFFDLQNAELVLAHEVSWRNYFKKHPNQYEVLWDKAPFMIFKRKNFQSTYFISGAGEVLEQTSNSVKISLKTNDAIIKFNYFPFLEAGNCELSPYNAELEFPLIKLSNCKINEVIEIKSINPLARLLK